MRHLALIMALLPAAAAAAGAAELPKKWTHGRSSCDPVVGQLPDAAAPTANDRRRLESAWDYAVADVESLSALGCFADASRSAALFAARLRSLEEPVLLGVRADACSEAAKPRLERFELVRASIAGMRSSEALFEEALGRYEEIERSVFAAIPADGVPFDDCRAKAQRGWARARASLNRLSCEISSSLDRLDAFRERAEQVALATFDCAPQATQAAAAESAPSAVLFAVPAGVAPMEPSGYQAFPGAELPPASSSLKAP